MIGGFHRAITITIYSDALIPGLCKEGEYLCYSLAPEAVTGLYHVHILHFLILHKQFCTLQNPFIIHLLTGPFVLC